MQLVQKHCSIPSWICVLKTDVFWDVIPCSLVETCQYLRGPSGSSKTVVVLCQTTWRQIPEHSNFHSHGHENLTFNCLLSDRADESVNLFMVSFRISRIKIYVTVVLPVVLFGCEVGLSDWVKNVGWGCSRSECWGGHLVLSGKKWQAVAIIV